MPLTPRSQLLCYRKKENHPPYSYYEVENNPELLENSVHLSVNMAHVSNIADVCTSTICLTSWPASQTPPRHFRLECTCATYVSLKVANKLASSQMSTLPHAALFLSSPPECDRWPEPVRHIHTDLFNISQQ